MVWLLIVIAAVIVVVGILILVYWQPPPPPPPPAPPVSNPVPGSAVSQPVTATSIAAAAPNGIGATVVVADGTTATIYSDVPSTTHLPGLQKIQVVRSSVPSSGFGATSESVALTSDYLAIGAPLDTTYSTIARGVVYVYQRTVINSWFLKQKLTTDLRSSVVPSEFGRSVSLAGSLLIIGDPLAFNGGGCVFVYRLIGSEFVLTQKLTSSYPGTGRLTAILGTTIVVATDSKVLLYTLGTTGYLLSAVWQYTASKLVASSKYVAIIDSSFTYILDVNGIIYRRYSPGISVAITDHAVWLSSSAECRYLSLSDSTTAVYPFSGAVAVGTHYYCLTPSQLFLV